jgi:phosphoglycerate dehydrogenase-like enzyme
MSRFCHRALDHRTLGCKVIFRPSKTSEELIAACADANYVITHFSQVTAEIIAAMRKVQVITRYGIGVDNIDVWSQTDPTWKADGESTPRETRRIPIRCKH